MYQMVLLVGAMYRRTVTGDISARPCPGRGPMEGNANQGFAKSAHPWLSSRRASGAYPFPYSIANRKSNPVTQVAKTPTEYVTVILHSSTKP